jgi:chemotaxis response regulator CheB
MAGRDTVVVGGSAGSIEAVAALVRGLPQGFAGSLFVVVPFPASVTSTLPRILSRPALSQPVMPPMVSESSRDESTLPDPTVISC